MKGTLFLITFYFITFLSISQESINLEVKKHYQNYVIIPTWKNLSQVLFSDYSVFISTMKKYNYSKPSGGDSYIANTSAGSPYFTIDKRNREVVMIFTEDMGYASRFRNEIRNLLEGSNRPVFDSGYEVYYINTKVKGSLKKIKIAIKESSSGSSTFAIVLL